MFNQPENIKQYLPLVEDRDLSVLNTLRLQLTMYPAAQDVLEPPQQFLYKCLSDVEAQIFEPRRLETTLFPLSVASSFLDLSIN